MRTKIKIQVAAMPYGDDEKWADTTALSLTSDADIMTWALSQNRDWAVKRSKLADGTTHMIEFEGYVDTPAPIK